MSEKKQLNNYAFIDSQNLNLGIKHNIYEDEEETLLLHEGWKLDFKRFRVYLQDRYSVSSAYLFIGYIPSEQPMYKTLQEWGYTLIFKETQRKADGSPKGNVDAELVLNAMIEYDNYDQAIIVTGDGDFACLTDYLRRKNKLCVHLAPNEIRYSSLLKKAAGPRLAFVSRLRKKLEYKAPK